jgi:hypothetical protein
MLRIGRQNQATSIRVPDQVGSPTPEDLEFLLSKAQRNWRTAVELPFRNPDGIGSFIVVVKCEMGSGQPNWSLYRADEAGYPIVWTHMSSDMLLISNLVSLEATAAKERREREAAKAAAALREEQVPVQFDVPAEEIVKEITIDQDVLRSVEMNLSRAETGLFTFPSYLYFLQNEHVRYSRGGQGYTVIVCEMCVRQEDYYSPLPISGVREAAKRVLGMKRTLDIMAHYEALEFAFLLPHTDAAGAGIFISRVFRLLTETPVTDEVPASDIQFFFGIAGVPQHADKPGRALGLAAAACQRGKQTATAIVCTNTDSSESI